MKEQLKKQDMVVGKQYKGYAWRNEYGEFFFRPSAVGDEGVGAGVYQDTALPGWGNGLHQGSHRRSKQTYSSFYEV